MKKRLLATILALCMVLGLLPGTAWAAEVVDSGYCGSNVQWTLDNEGLLTISGKGEMNDYNNINGYWHLPENWPWFYSCRRVKKIIIEDGIEKIGNNAFYGFENVISIKIPASVNAGLEICELSNCFALEEITVAGNNQTYLAQDGVLFNTDMTELICYPASKSEATYEIPNSVKVIQQYAFCGSDFSSITIPESVTTVNSYAFFGSRLTNVTLPNSIISMGWGIFESCHYLESVILPTNSTIGSLPMDTFFSCENLKTIIFPKEITYIQKGAFDGCINLSDIYYNGSETQWQDIRFQNKNDKAFFPNATIHYNSTGPGQPNNPNPPTPPEDTESTLAFFGDWDAANKRMKPTTIAMAGGYTVTDKTVVSGASSIEELVNHYVMVDKEKSSSGLWPEAVRIRPVETRIGEITSVERAAGEDLFEFTIDGNSYIIPFDKLFKLVRPASLENVREHFWGRKALCIFDGDELIRLDSLQFAAGTIKNSGSGIFKLEPLVTLETEMTTEMRDTEQYYAVCADTVSSIPAVGSAAGCYQNMDGVLLKIDERTYQTKVGTLGRYESASDMAVIDGVSVHVNAEEWEWNKNTERKPNVGDYVGERVFYLLANNEIVHMDSLEKIEYQLTATYSGDGIVVNHATYQNGSFDNSGTTVGNSPILATISYKQTKHRLTRVNTPEYEVLGVKNQIFHSNETRSPVAWTWERMMSATCRRSSKSILSQLPRWADRNSIFCGETVSAFSAAISLMSLCRLASSSSILPLA